MGKIKALAYRILRWSEKYTKTDMVYLAKKVAWPVLGQVVASVSALILAIAFSRLVSKETFGTYKFVLSIPPIFGVLLLPGLGTSLTRAIAKGHEGDFNVVVKSKTRWAILFWFVSLCISIYYWAHSNTLIGFSLLILSTGTVLNEIFGLYGAVLAGRALLKEGTLLYIAERFFTLAIMLVIMFYSSNIIIVIFGSLIAGVTINYLGFLITKRSLLHNDVKGDGVLHYGRHLSFMTVISSAVGDLDNLIVFHFIGAPALAVYSYAQAIPEQLKGPLSGLSTLVFSKFAKHKGSDIKRDIYHKFKILFLSVVPLILIYWLAAPYIFKVLFPQYLDAVFYSQIFSLSLVSFAFFPATTYLSAQRKIKEQYIANTLTAVFQLITMLVFIIQWGLLGLIIARIITRLFTSFVNVWLVYRSD